MAAAAIVVTGIGSSDPYDQLHIDFTVYVEGVLSGWTGDVDVAFDASADNINASVRVAATMVAAGHSVSVTSSDVKRVIGGALETVA